jgi:hypothetical protein
MVGAGCDRFGAQGLSSAATLSGIRGWRVAEPEAKRYTRPPGKEDERNARRRSRSATLRTFREVRHCQLDAWASCASGAVSGGPAHAPVGAESVGWREGVTRDPRQENRRSRSVSRVGS